MPLVRLSRFEAANVRIQRTTQREAAHAALRQRRREATESRLDRIVGALAFTLPREALPVCKACAVFPCECWHATREAGIRAFNAMQA